MKGDRVLLLQTRKQDKNKYRLSQKEKVTDDAQQNKAKTSEEEKKGEERRLRKEEIESKRKAVK